MPGLAGRAVGPSGVGAAVGMGVSVGTDVLIKGRKVAELHLIVDNLTDVCYQNHLSRLKYADVNVVTGRRGVFNMGRNFVFKLTVPIG